MSVITPIFKLNTKEQWRPQPVETAERFGTIGGQKVVLAALPASGATGAGRSPESPGSQGERWHAPAMYHAGAG